MTTAFEEFLTTLPQRDTTPPGVKAVEDYTFDQLVTHLHDHHGYGAESQVDDETSNQILPAESLDRLAHMTRDEAIARLPGHYFQGWDGPDSLESARIHHAEDHGNTHGGGALVHFHPGTFKQD